LIEGGRGGGKSQAIGRYLLYLAEIRKIRCVCGRETQTSISESVYSLLADLIIKFNLNFEVQANRITSRVSGSVINFRGFRDQGRFSIQGLEGIDFLWVDESQAVTKGTLDVLIPTIRKDDAKIFFSMNRHVVDDPVYSFCSGRSDCLHININYNENNYCTQALIHEADECKKKSIADYNHIWLGEPLLKTEDSVFSFADIEKARNNIYPLRDAYGLKIGGFDVARYGDDKCACFGLQQRGSLHWAECYVDQWDHVDLNYTTGRILATHTGQSFERSIIDEDGIGAGPLDTLTKGRQMDVITGFRNLPLNFKDNKFYANARTANAYKVRDMIQDGHLQILDEETLKELLTLKYTFDHYQRRILISKEVMKTKYKIKSPNKADSLIMVVSMIGNIKYGQDVQYRHNQQYAPDSNLFQLAGV
jgi:phage terminase large subunit